MTKQQELKAKELIATIKNEGLRKVVLEDFEESLKGAMLYDDSLASVIIRIAKKYTTSPETDMSFGQALEALESNLKVQRVGWNGKGMWITLSPGSDNLPADKFWSPNNADYAQSVGGSAKVNPCITMKNVNGEIQMGWAPSQEDMLAKDWQIVS